MMVLMMNISFYSFFLLMIFLRIFLEFDNESTFQILCGYGFGCTYSALFARISGGIFTKGADISCDVVGKLEDHNKTAFMNPSSVADNLGDLVGDLAGSVLDLIASIVETFCSVSLILSYMNDTEEKNFEFIMIFFTLFSTSVIVYIFIEFYESHLAESGEIISDIEIEGFLFKFIRVSTLIMSLCTILLFAYISPDGIWFQSFFISKYRIMTAVLIGLLTSYLITYSTYYYTGKSFQFIQNLAKVTIESPVLNVIYGLSIGFLSTLAPMVILALTIFFSDLLCGILGVAFASFGFLLNLPIILLFQMFGPIADVCLGIISIINYDSLLALKGRFINQLDITGNTMSAVVKGFASGSAALVSFGLFSTLMVSTNIYFVNFYNIDCLMFLLFGAAFVYLIQSLCMFATSSNASLLIKECRKQLKNVEIVEGTQVRKESDIKPDYFECIQLSANNALVNATYITWLCIIVNIAVGFFLGFSCVVSFLTGLIISGIPITISSSNSGSAWDNSKKIIETDQSITNLSSPRQNYKLLPINEEEMQQKQKEKDEDSSEYNSLRYSPVVTEEDKRKRRRSIKNAIIGDNIGDAFKDIAGPAINILIKFSSYFILIIINYLNISS
jgi:K(+)-stimulated pyrophosphate-energized sodium pump